MIQIFFVLHKSPFRSLQLRPFSSALARTCRGSRGISARLRNGVHASFPSLFSPAWPFPSCLPSLYTPRIALFQNTPVSLPAPEMLLSHPPWGTQEPHFIGSLSCAVSWARHSISLLRRCKSLVLSIVQQRQWGARKGEGTCPESHSQGTQLLACPSVLRTQGPFTPPHGLAFLPSYIFITFQALLPNCQMLFE